MHPWNPKVLSTDQASNWGRGAVEPVQEHLDKSESKEQNIPNEIITCHSDDFQREASM